MRLIHTSDWQIGKAFSFADDATREILRNERLEPASRDKACTMLTVLDVAIMLTTA